MSSVYWPLPVMNLWSSLRRTAAPIPVALMAFPPAGIGWMFLICLLRAALRHRLWPRGDRLHDVVVAGAAADVAFELVADGLVVEVVALAVYHINRLHDHAGRTETSLQAVIVAERFLHRVQRAVLRQALDRGDGCAFGLPGEHGAGLHGLAVHVDHAGAALRGVTPDMGAGETQALAQVLNQQSAGVGVRGDGLAVHRHRDCGHIPPPRKAGPKALILRPNTPARPVPGAKSERFCRKSLIGTRTTLNRGAMKGQGTRAPAVFRIRGIIGA